MREIQAQTVHVLGSTAPPAGARAAPQARTLLMEVGGRAGRFRFVIGDRDSTVTAAFDEVFAGHGTPVSKTPARSPRAYLSAERFAGTLRRGCPGPVRILGERHLPEVLAAYARHDTVHRPHQGLLQEPPPRQPSHPGRSQPPGSSAGRFRVVG